MLASTFLDLVVGVDVHFEMVPMPAPVPTPLPHPFMGMVWDPGGQIANLLISNGIEMAMAGALKPPKGPVLINYLPATNTGTDCKNKMVLPHFVLPPGTAWTPMPKAPKPKIGIHATPEPDPPVAPAGDAVLMMGSKTVIIMGSNAVRLGDLAMSCSEPVRLPSSSVLALPKGPPVMVGGPPAIDWQQAAGALLRSKWVSNHLHGLVSRIKNARLRNLLAKGVCFLTGHPIDVASGRMLTWMTDWELPGPIPIAFERNYASSWAARDGVMGSGWSHSLDEAVWIERGRVVYRADDGREIEFDTFHFPAHLMRKGDEVFEPINRLTLRSTGSFRWEIESSDGLVREFEQLPADARGVLSRLVRIRSRAGHEVRLEYDAAARLEWLRDSGGRLVRFEYDRQGRLFRVALPHPNQDGWLVHTEYRYSADGDLISASDPLGHVTHYEYAGHLMIRETDRTGLSFYFGYDGIGAEARCIRTWGDGGIYDHEVIYDVANHVTVVTNSVGETTMYAADALGLVRKMVDSLGNTTLYDYDEALRRTKVTLPDGSERSTKFDARGNLIESVAADGAKVELTYAGDDLPVSATMPTGGIWTWRYDDKERLIERRDPLGNMVRFHHDPATKMLAWIERPGGGRTSFSYDAALNITKVVAPDGVTRRFAYDRLGRVIEEVDGRGNSERTQYDPLDREVRVDRAHEPVRTLEYDAEGHPLRVAIGRRVIELGYTGRHVIATRTEAGTSVRFDYDTEDRIKAVTNEAGEVWRVQRDGGGRIVAETDFDGSVNRFKLNGCGRVVAATRPSGASTQLAYDPMGRLTKAIFSDGTTSEYRYGPDGLLAEAVNQHTRVSFERDPVGRVVRERQGDDWITSEYDASGRRVRFGSSLGIEQRIERDVRGNPKRITVGARTGNWWWADLARAPGGLETQRRFPAGEVLTERDGVGRPLTQRIVADGTERAARAYHWAEEDGRLALTVDSTRGPTVYQRDERGRLLEAVRPQVRRAEVLAPDAVGNVYGAADRSDRQYAPGGRLVAAGSTRFRHDADGELIEAGPEEGPASKFRWNASGLLTGVVLPDGGEVSFTYDALGRRLSKTSAAGSYRWLWDGNTPVHELSSTTSMVTWVFEPETMSPLGRFTADERAGVARDYQGTPHALVADDGTVTKLPLTVAGDLAEDATVSAGFFPWRFEGQYADQETGLHYNRFRYYDPGLARYVSKDPLGVLGGLNVYAYVGDPTAATDPFGLIDEWGTAPYGASTHTGDGLDAHELLQSAWLKENVPAYQGRGKGIGRQNPAMGLEPGFHDAVTAGQREAGLLNPANLAKQTAAQNIAKNAGILEAEMIAEGMSRKEAKALVKQFKKEAKEYADSIGCK